MVKVCFITILFSLFCLPHFPGHQENQSDKTFSVHTIGQSPKGSPLKVNRESRVASLSQEEGRRSRCASEERHPDRLTRSVSEDVTTRAEKTKSVTYADESLGMRIYFFMKC